MSMLKDAIAYIVSLNHHNAVLEINDTHYLLNDDGTLNMSLAAMQHEEEKRLRRSGHYEFPIIKTTTLSSIADYVDKDPECFFSNRCARPVIHIKTPTSVTLYADLDEFGRRMPIIQASATIPNIEFGRKMDVETFTIMLQSSFAGSDDRDYLLHAVSAVRVTNDLEIKDDGMAQTVSVNKGAATVARETLRNPVQLAPFRTFVEVPQPLSYYVFRVHDGPSVALYTAGGAEWEISAMANIKTYFEDAVKNEDAYIIV